jgi:endonuclease/exonuclease/phosphatase family metal-dependent hydrolase
MRHLLFSIIAGASACGQSSRVTATATDGKPAGLVVMTYNVNFGIGGDPDTIDVIRNANADVVFLQETTPAWESALRRELGATYPHAMFEHCCGAGGMAILSKLAIARHEIIQPPEGGWFPAWLVVLDTPLGALQALNVHLHPPIADNSASLVSGAIRGHFTTPAVREAEIATYVEQLDRSLPTLIVGDFNEQTDGRALAYLSRRGMTSALPALRGADEPTWQWNTSFGTLRRQLDHVVVDPARIEPLDARVIRGGRSDHHAVVVTLKTI